MVRIACCDDDKDVIKRLTELLDKYIVENNKYIEYVTFISPLELMASIEKGVYYDIIFLDVVMPGENGIEVAKEIREKDKEVKIIFLTSSEEYAVKSYTVGAFYYQMKPIWEEAFVQIMNTVMAEVEREDVRSLVVKSKDGITRLKISDIRYVEVVGHNIFFNLRDGRETECNGRLDEVSRTLSTYECFVRAHRSFLVNMDYISNISYKAVILTDDTEIPIPRGKYTELKDAYLKYAFTNQQVIM